MLRRFLILVIGLLTLGATPMPNQHVLMDFMKTQLVWSWVQGKGPAALGFKIYCGAANNMSAPSPTGQTFMDPIMVDIPDPTARTYLIGPVIMPLIMDYGTKTANYAKLLNVLCVVTPYNKAGESADGTPGTPLRVIAVYFQVRS